MRLRQIKLKQKICLTQFQPSTGKCNIQWSFWMSHWVWIWLWARNRDWTGKTRHLIWLSRPRDSQLGSFKVIWKGSYLEVHDRNHKLIMPKKLSNWQWKTTWRFYQIAIKVGAHPNSVDVYKVGILKSAKS